MKRILTLAILFLATTVVAVSAVASQLPATQIDLTVSPAKTLPGLPVPLLLHIRNGASEVQIAPGVRVRVTSPTGETFLAQWYDRIEAGQLELGLSAEEESDVLKLPPNATIDLSVPAVAFTEQSWAHDRRLMSMPGTWKLEVLLYDVRTEKRIASAPATLEIQTPAAGDVWIWEELLRGNWGLLR